MWRAVSWWRGWRGGREELMVRTSAGDEAGGQDPFPMANGELMTTHGLPALSLRALAMNYCFYHFVIGMFAATNPEWLRFLPWRPHAYEAAVDGLPSQRMSRTRAWLLLFSQSIPQLLLQTLLLFNMPSPSGVGPLHLLLVFSICCSAAALGPRVKRARVAEAAHVVQVTASKIVQRPAALSREASATRFELMSCR